MRGVPFCFGWTLMKSPHCCLENTHHINTGTPWRCYWTHPCHHPVFSRDWTHLVKTTHTSGQNDELWGSEKPQTTFIRIQTAGSLVPSGVGIIFSVVPDAWRPGCLPFILGNGPVPPAFTLQLSFHWPEGRFSFPLLGAHRPEEIRVLCLFMLLMNSP